MKRDKKPKRLSMRVGMKVEFYICDAEVKCIDSTWKLQDALTTVPCGDPGTSIECKGCKGGRRYTFKLVKKEVVK